MIKKFPLLLTIVLGFTSFDQGGRPDRPEPTDRIFRLYRRADSLFHLDKTTPQTDSAALSGFNEVIRTILSAAAFPGRDSLLARSYLDKGILLDVRLDYAGAKDAYCRSLQLLLKRDDSLLFVASVFAGASFYNLNIFDSCNYFLQRAETMADRYPNTEDAVRLYNTLGVLYHDNGNYLQGKNYFSRALQIIQDKKPFDTASAVNLQTNIATCYYRLGYCREALDIYNKILTYRMFTQSIHMNMGMAYSVLGESREALRSFAKVDEKQIPSVLNEKSDVYLQLNETDSAQTCLDRLRGLEGKAQVNQADLGINELLRADLLDRRRQYLDALASLQRAMGYFARDYNNPDIFSNPAEFTGTYACYRLFDALHNKAVVFGKLYRSQPKEQYLQASFDAYRSALALLRYIEKSYDTDDAKIFLKKNNTALYHGALSECLELYRLHPDRDYLARAFLISERNKASIISANLKERAFNKLPGVDEELLNKERNIKYNIARLNAGSEAAADSHQLQTIAAEKAGYELQLARVQKDLEKNGNFYRLKYDDDAPGIAEFQNRLKPGQVLFSFAETDSALHVFALTHSSFGYRKIDSLNDLQQDVASWVKALKTAGNGRRFSADNIGPDLYGRLIAPMQTLAPGQQEWIIVPEGFLYFLPFESLPATTGGDHYLLETTTVSYQFSARFMLNDALSAGKRPPSRYPGQVLAFAPYVSNAGKLGSDGGQYFNRLPASGQEIAALPGLHFIDSQATKAHFLEELNKYPILHLATHAVSSINNAAASFIAFYPAKGVVFDDCLFLEELYGLNLNATRLVVISACETGQGELVSNEGVISLARAFAYAGCESSVNSLWNADDQSTGFILKRFHVYLEQGYTKSNALRQAKLDYLHSDALDKSPAYWAHLVLMGNTDGVYPKKIDWTKPLAILAGILLTGGLIWTLRRKRMVRSTKKE